MEIPGQLSVEINSREVELYKTSVNLMIFFLFMQTLAIHAMEFKHPCPKPVPALTSMKGVTAFYEETESQSVLDDEKYSKYLALTWKFDALLKRLTLISQLGQEECLDEQLMEWAVNDGLLRDIETSPGVGRRQAVMLQTWAVVAITSAVAYQHQSYDVQVDSNIRKWLTKLGWSISDEFSVKPGRPNWLNSPNNQNYWGGLAQVRVGLLIDDNALFNSGMQIMERGISDITNEGTLPAETKRGTRAIHYQNFALLPLLGLVEASLYKKRPIDDQKLDKILLLARTTFNFTLNSTANQSRKFADQKLNRLEEELAWVPLIYRMAQQRDPEFAKKLQRTIHSFPKLINRFYGCSFEVDYQMCG